MNGFVMLNGNFLDRKPDGYSFEDLIEGRCIGASSLGDMLCIFGVDISWYQFLWIKNRLLDGPFISVCVRMKFFKNTCVFTKDEFLQFKNTYNLFDEISYRGVL